jgi:hypothetical protein
MVHYPFDSSACDASKKVNDVSWKVMGNGCIDLVHCAVDGEAAVGIPHHLDGRVLHPGGETNFAKSIPRQRILLSR